MEAAFRRDEQVQVNSRMRFLIIDDSVTMRRIIANILARLGHPEVLHASNGREALDRLAAEHVDVVITDWYMPEMNGLDFVTTLRNTPATSHIPIVIVTANAASDDIQHALQLGVKSYILKPFTVETMKDKIDALLAQLEGGAGAGDGEAAPVAAAELSAAEPSAAEPSPAAAPAHAPTPVVPAATDEPGPEADIDAAAALVTGAAAEAECEPSVVA
jgi:two-component system, chemotaxis family, chemotaxis protein CheY